MLILVTLLVTPYHATFTVHVINVSSSGLGTWLFSSCQFTVCFCDVSFSFIYLSFLHSYSIPLPSSYCTLYVSYMYPFQYYIVSLIGWFHLRYFAHRVLRFPSFPFLHSLCSYLCYFVICLYHSCVLLYIVFLSLLISRLLRLLTRLSQCLVSF